MGQTFTAVVQRQNSQDVDAGWWNILQQAGQNLESVFGIAGFQGETTFAIVNNQASAANVTGALFNGATQRAFELEYQIYRNTTSTGATELAEKGFLRGVYSTVAGTWELGQDGVVGNAGVTFTITTAGQVQYTSTNITGTAASSGMTFKFTTMGV